MATKPFLAYSPAAYLVATCHNYTSHVFPSQTEQILPISDERHGATGLLVVTVALSKMKLLATHSELH